MITEHIEIPWNKRSPAKIKMRFNTRTGSIKWDCGGIDHYEESSNEFRDICRNSGMREELSAIVKSDRCEGIIGTRWGHLKGVDHSVIHEINACIRKHWIPAIDYMQNNSCIKLR